MDTDAFVRRLRAYRKLKQYTQQEFAEQIGVSVALIGGLERGTRRPSERDVERIMAVLQVSRTDLGL